MKMIKYLLLAPLMATSLFVAGCGTSTTDRALSGGLLGAGAGAAIGSMSGNTGQGALIGAAVGAAAGAIVPADQVNLGDPVWRRNHHCVQYNARNECTQWANN
jgi:osmotically inducible lipoprotein OsmB